MSYTTKIFAAALVCLTGTMVSLNAHAGTFSTGFFDNATHLGLTGLTPAQVASFVQAEDSGPSGANAIVGQITFTGPPTVFTAGHTYSTANFADNNNVTNKINQLANTTYLFSPNINATVTDTKIISGLTLGSSYQLQLIFYDGDNSVNSEEDRGLMQITAGSDVLSNFNAYNVISGTTGTTNASPGPNGFYDNRGAFVRYNFVATGATLTLNFAPPFIEETNSGKYLVLSGYTLQAVPEPASASLLLLGGCGVTLARRLAKRRGGK